tara:strand:- start:4010 stop:4738 length:729 start_codon:yes stop_codon:yes gene_type:complete
LILDAESKIFLLQYKLYYEEIDVVNDEFQKGQADLLIYVTNFRENLSEEVEGQRKDFNQHFFGDRDIEEKLDSQPAPAQIPEQTEEKTNSTVVKWAKNLYRKIAIATHPDKTMHLGVPSLVKKFNKYYNTAISDYAAGQYDSLLFIGFELGLEIPAEKITDYIVPKNIALSKEIEKKKKSIAYQWQKVPEKDKNEVLEKYLTSLGYIFDKKDIEATIKRVRKIKRKVGTRPVNIIKKRIKKN